MEKRLKYLLWLLVVWFWLLFNQTFAFWSPTIWELTLFVEWVTLPWTNSHMRSSTYQYSFHNWGYSYYSRRVASLSYQRKINWNNYSSVNWDSHDDCNFSWANYQFNNTIFGQSLYNARFTDLFDNWHCNWYIWNQSSWWYTPIKVVLWQWNDFWKNFVYTNSALNDTWIYTPHYMLWGGFMTSNDFVERNLSQVNWFLRLFWRQNSTNLNDPQENLDFVKWNTYWSWTIAWQYFTNNWFVYQTKNQEFQKSFGDLWWQYTKWLHFWWYWMWYSFAIRTWNPLTWNSFSFASVWSRCLESLMTIWMSDPNSWTSSWCQYLWLLTLKWDTYVSQSNNASVIVLSKNPDNHRQILYEQFDCAEDDIQRLFNTNYCNSIWHWYITIWWNWNVLPNWNNWSYTLWSWNAFLDTLFNWNEYYWFVSMWSNTYCLNRWKYVWTIDSTCFKLTSTPNSSSIKEMYINWDFGSDSSIIYWTWSNWWHTNSLYYSCLWPSYGTIDWLPPAYCYNENCELDVNRLKSCYQTIEYLSDWSPLQRTFCEINWIEQEISFVQVWSWSCVWSWSNWSWWYAITPCTWDDCGLNILDWLNIWFTEEYFSWFLNTPWRFFKCPFPYPENLVIRPRLMKFFNWFDIALPYNCSIAWFYQWKKAFTLQNSWHFLDQPLLHFEWSNRTMLYTFFDILLIIWMIFFFSRFTKFFKS